VELDAGTHLEHAVLSALPVTGSARNGTYFSSRPDGHVS